MDSSIDSAALIHTLVELGRTLGLITLAEGIEDDHQLEGLRNEQCDRGQGFFFSRPVLPENIQELLHGSARTHIVDASVRVRETTVGPTQT
jgi:EAL domain-containing protein (putative c-di-GMP-specific phosphodiesterase class I)